MLGKQYDIAQIKWELDSLTEILDWYRSAGDHSEQVCLQSIKGDSDPYKNGCGSISRFPDRREDDYTLINDKFKGTIFEGLVAPYVRSRLMWMSDHSTYSVHQDKSPRYHLAINTHEHAYFFWPESKKLLHIPADGYMYRVDTTLPHTFINCGPARTHLVCVEPSTLSGAGFGGA
ncbi:MAG TPA: hypothetical protein EYQ21_00020 [Flavobacteriales bacterium]|nr:hypothetical protein [Flavobacteriales bacterium]